MNSSKNSKSNKKPVVYAFIDSQNLNLGIKASGWTLDFRKFRLYLKNKYGVERAYIFIGQVAGNESLYTALNEMGYILVMKPTTEYKVDGKVTVKGNVDAELVLHAAAIQYTHYDSAIIVSGDGDFTCLVEFLDKRSKLLYVLTPNRHYSSLLRRFDRYIKRIDNVRGSLEYKPTKKTKTSGRSKP